MKNFSFGMARIVPASVVTLVGGAACARAVDAGHANAQCSVELVRSGELGGRVECFMHAVQVKASVEI